MNFDIYVYNSVIIYVLQNSNSSSNTNTYTYINTNIIASHGLTITDNEYDSDACTLFEIASLYFM